MYVYLFYGNNLSVFRQSAIDFHRAVALMQLQLRTGDLSSGGDGGCQTNDV